MIHSGASGRRFNCPSLDYPPKVIAVTSALSGEGKSMIVRNLALVYREAGARVAVVDFDLRRPVQPGLFGVESNRGIAQILVGDATIEEGLVPIFSSRQPVAASHSGGGIGTVVASEGSANGSEDLAGSLVLLPTGGQITNPDAVLGSDRLEQLVAALADKFELS